MTNDRRLELIAKGLSLNWDVVRDVVLKRGEEYLDALSVLSDIGFDVGTLLKLGSAVEGENKDAVRAAFQVITK